MRRLLSCVSAGLACVALLGGCASTEALGFGAITLLSEGVINDPSNKSLRFDILEFGLEQFCVEMNRRGAAVKLRDGEPVLGRFFAESCSTQIIDEEQRQSFIVQYSGLGYGYTNLTRRLGFQSSGLIEYAVDFQIQGEAMYIYFRPRNVGSTTFQVRLVEGALAQAGIAVTGVNPDQLGRNMLDSQLRRGFTVIRYSKRGETDFAMGLVPVGHRPFKPFQVVESEKQALDNDRTEVHQNQQDFVGGIHVPKDGQAITLTMTLDGAAAVDVFLVAKQNGDLMVTRYASAAGPVPMVGTPVASEVLSAGQPLKRTVPVPAGTYYLMLDHSPAAGPTTPPTVLLDDRAARIDYLVQVADTP